MTHLEQLWHEFSEAITDGVLPADAMLTLTGEGAVRLRFNDQLYPFISHGQAREWLSNQRVTAAADKRPCGLVTIGGINIRLVPPAPLPS